MQIKYMKVRGSIGFKKAFGVDEIEFDFEDKTGLIALSGKNGNGKTTFIELMQHYLSFPSRKNARKKKFHHGFFLRDSFVETISVFNDKEYHIIKKIDSQTNKCEGFIKVDGSEKSETTGKISEYYKYIEKTFGSEDLYYKSIFCAQGSEKISEMTAGPIKKLLVEFLRIDNLVAHEDSAKKAVLFFETKKEIHETEITRLNSEIEKAGECVNGLVMLNEEKSGIQRNINHNEKVIKELRSTLDDKKEQKNENKIIFEKKETLSEDVLRISGKIGDINKEFDLCTAGNDYFSDTIQIELKMHDKILSEKKSILSASENLKKDQEKLTESNIKLDELKIKSRSLIDNDNDLRLKSGKFVHEYELLENDPDLKDLKQIGIDSANKIISLGKDIEAKQVEIDALNNSPLLLKFKTEIETLNKIISLSVNPDCNLDCPAKSSVEEAITSLPELRFEVKAIKSNISKKMVIVSKDHADLILKKENQKTETDKLRDKYVIKNNEIKKKLEGINNDREKNAELKNDIQSRIILNNSGIKSRNETIAYIGKQIEKNQELSGKLTELKVAESKIEDIKKRISEETESFNKKIKDLETKKAGKESELKTINNEVEKLEKKINLTIDADIEFYQKKIGDSEGSNDKTKESIKILDRNIAVFENDLKKKDKYVVQEKNQKRIIKAISKEISEWTYVRLGCSKNGLQALEIDGAAPLITREANKLLELSFGLDYQIKIVTQDPESGKEVFWINVIEGDGTETEIGLFSGGEKVWIVKAITLALSIVSKQKSGKSFESIFTDEEDGALDNENAIMFIELYRSLMTHGDFNTCFYISHNPQSVSMADHIVEFSGNGPRWM